MATTSLEEMAIEKMFRRTKRHVVMKELTPKEAGYLMSGNTEADVEVTEEGIRIREKGIKRGSPWKTITWTEIWINAAREAK